MSSTLTMFAAGVPGLNFRETIWWRVIFVFFEGVFELKSELFGENEGSCSCDILC